MSSGKKLVLLIDDDSICNSINRTFLCRKLGCGEKNDLEIIAFQEPIEGLKFLIKALSEKLYTKIIILLDINMPIMSGWEFLDEYAMLFKNQTDVTIFILTSSVNQNDIERAGANPNVTDFISKPLRTESLELICEQLQ